MKLPSFAQIEVVGQCNLRCTMCPIQFRRDGPPYGPPAFMDYDRYTRLVDELDGVETLQLQGLGEPMMHPRFFEMVSYAAKKGIRVTASSNLTLLSQRKAEECVASGLDTLFVSIDGAQPETFERIRVRAKLERVVQNVVALRQAKQRTGSLLPRLKMSVVIMRQNLDELPDLVRLGHRLEMEGISVQQLPHGFGDHKLPSQYRPMVDFVEKQALRGEAPDRVEQVFAEARRLADELAIELRLPKVKPSEPAKGASCKKRCDWPWERAYVSYDGKAMPCAMVSTPDRARLGDVGGPGGFAKVWNGPAYQAFREQLASDEPPDVCRTCSVYQGTL